MAVSNHARHSYETKAEAADRKAWMEFDRNEMLEPCAPKPMRTENEVEADINRLNDQIAKLREEAEFEWRMDLRRRLLGKIEGANSTRVSYYEELRKIRKAA